MNWSVFITVLLASSVEFIEALTIVLAVGVAVGYRTAFTAAGAALVVLGGGAALIQGIAITGPVLGVAQLVIGLLLLLFGSRWLRKAILRSSGYIALHDESTAYQRALGQLEGPTRGQRSGGFVMAFNGVLLEGVEVIFIVVTLGAAGQMMSSAFWGAGAGLVAVSSAGLLVKAPITRVPENTLKFVVGLLLTTFGTFWAGEGIGVMWPGADASLLGLLALFLLGSWLLVRTARTRREALSA